MSLPARECDPTCNQIPECATAVDVVAARLGLPDTCYDFVSAIRTIATDAVDITELDSDLEALTTQVEALTTAVDVLETGLTAAQADIDAIEAGEVAVTSVEAAPGSSILVTGTGTAADPFIIDSTIEDESVTASWILTTDTGAIPFDATLYRVNRDVTMVVPNVVAPAASTTFAISGPIPAGFEPSAAAHNGGVPLPFTISHTAALDSGGGGASVITSPWRANYTAGAVSGSLYNSLTAAPLYPSATYTLLSFTDGWLTDIAP